MQPSKPCTFLLFKHGHTQSPLTNIPSPTPNSPCTACPPPFPKSLLSLLPLIQPSRPYTLFQTWSYAVTLNQHILPLHPPPFHLPCNPPPFSTVSSPPLLPRSLLPLIQPSKLYTLFFFFLSWSYTIIPKPTHLPPPPDPHTIPPTPTTVLQYPPSQWQLPLLVAKDHCCRCRSCSRSPQCQT